MRERSPVRTRKVLVLNFIVSDFFCVVEGPQVQLIVLFFWREKEKDEINSRNTLSDAPRGYLGKLDTSQLHG